MANIFELDNQQRKLIDLLENEQSLTGEERQELTSELDRIYQQKGLALLPLFDTIEYLVMQNNHAEEKIEEIRKLVKKNQRIIDRLYGLVKHIFITTGQKLFQPTPTVAFKVRKLPKRVEVIDDELIPDDFKTVSLTLPMSVARIVALEYPHLKIDLDSKKKEVSKREIKRLFDEGVELEGVKIIDDDFTVVKDGV